MIVTIMICNAPGCHTSNQFAGDSEADVTRQISASRWEIWGMHHTCPGCVADREAQRVSTAKGNR